MDKKVKAAWLKALRGGKYKQGRQALKTSSGKYCCLGVLCEIYNKAHKNHPRVKAVELIGEAFPPPKVYRWAKIKPTESEDVAVVVNGEQTALSKLNDGESDEEIKRHSFKQIASIIEKNL